MTLISDEVLCAFMDGELDHETANKVQHELKTNARLQRRLDTLRALESVVGRAYPEHAEDSASARFDQLLGSSQQHDPIRSIGARLAALVAVLARPVSIGPAIGGLAAGVAAAVFFLPESDDPAILQTQGGFVVAEATARLLDEFPAGAPVDVAGETGMIRISFEDASGRLCRQFALGQSEIIACRQGAAWSVEALARGVGAPDVQGYQLAAGNTPAEIAAALERLEASTALDAEAERAAIAAGWARVDR